MLDVNKITSVLERLPDAALQQYAAMHKQDPYVLSLAVEESNRRKRLRAAPAQGGQPSQPPVNEQVVQSMAPEESGIAQLPAGDMEFADGGVVAFAGGGGAGIYDYLPEFMRRRLLENAQIAGAVDSRTPPSAPTSEMPGILDALKYAYGGAKERFSDFLTQRVAQHAQDVSDANIPGPPSRYAGMRAPSAEASAAPTGGAVADKPIAPGPAQPRPEDIGGQSARERTSMSAATRGPSGGYDPAAEYLRMRDQVHRADPAAADIAAYTAEQERLAKERLAQLEAERPQGEAYSGLEASLKKKEAEAGDKREENLKMALINAGLGMLAGTSQHALVNIGAGAKEGMRTYQQGLEKLEQAAEKRQELAVKIEEARRAEKENRAKEAYALRKEAADIAGEGRKLQIAGVRDAFGKSEKAATDLVTVSAQLEARRMADAAAARREEAAASRQGQNLDRVELMEIGKNLRDALTQVQKELPGTFDAGRREFLMKEEKRLRAALSGVTQQLAKRQRLEVPDYGTIDLTGWGKPETVKGGK